MKARELRRVAAELDRRESALRVRFLDPVAGIKGWTPASVDFVAAYVGLLHSEAEYCLERIIELLLENARNKTVHYQPDGVLINCCMFYRHQMHRSLGAIDLVPKRAQLKTDAPALLASWDDMGGRVFFEELRVSNHGAGMSYVERMFHPLGVVVREKMFRRLSSAGVLELVHLGPATTTMLTEFVLLRGSAVHAGTRKFANDIQNESPQAIGNRGRGVVNFVDEITRTLAQTVW